MQKEEMPDKLRKAVGWKFWFLDKDGGLDPAEMEALVERLNGG